MTFLLFLADSLQQRGVKASIFALDYSLAPEAPFPAQLEQAANGYQYLVKGLGIATEKIAFLGDSAGANLCLSLATHLNSPHPEISLNPTSGLSKPKLALLISPWVTFRTDNPTYKENELLDFLPKDAVEHLASCFRRPIDQSKELLQKYTEFVKIRRDWSAVLPERTWVFGWWRGSVFGRYQGILRLVHDPPISECMTRADAYLDLPLGEAIGEGMLPVTSGLSSVVAKCILSLIVCTALIVVFITEAEDFEETEVVAADPSRGVGGSSEEKVEMVQGTFEVV
ncbi:alpha/beta-hydrolase [Wilcoxina mikolae CBS 423.85]|nr:alpha/beta-hydrolase [Wilcoxina mikolae CBS 423.85]